MNQNYLAKAFLSCSLRAEDKRFVDFVASILDYCGILPFGTVGLYDSSTDNPVTLMKQNIEQSDFVVIAATKRYLTKDSHNGKESNALSEMIHTEAGMAFASSKPLVVFVEKGTDVGNFLPTITQYITLDGTRENVVQNKILIERLLNSAYQKSQENRRKKSRGELMSFVRGGLALWGGYQLLNSINNEEEYEECCCEE